MTWAFLLKYFRLHPHRLRTGTKIDKLSDWINCFKNYSDVTAGQFLTLLVSGFKSLLGKNKCSSQCHNSSTLFQLTTAVHFLRTEGKTGSQT